VKSQRLSQIHPRGLDNAGKTTIVKKIMNEDVNGVSPTLGFIIKTIEYDGFVTTAPVISERALMCPKATSSTFVRAPASVPSLAMLTTCL
jgi:hypothetical protein